MALLALSESFVAAVTGAGSPVSSLADAYSEAAKAMAQVFQHCSTANLRFCSTFVPLFVYKFPPQHALSTARQKLLAAVRPASGAQQPLCETALDSYVGDAARAGPHFTCSLIVQKCRFWH